MVYMLLGTGFEETEAIAPLDLLRRAGVEVMTVGVNGKIIKGSHNIGVEADIELREMDLTISLDVPTDFTEKMMRSREAATNTHADIHEQDLEYLATCRRTGKAAAKFYNWTVIDCVRDGAMRSIEDIHEEIYRHVLNCLED